MATKSITKDIHIRTKADAKRLIGALEKSQRRTPANIVMSKVCRDVKGDDIKKLFGNLDERV